MSPLGPPAPGLRVPCAPCPVWVCPEWGLCAEGAGLLAPTLHRAAGMTTAQAVFRPGAACTVSWSAGPGQAGREGWLVGRAPPQPCSPPTLPSGLAGGKWGLPSCIREGDTGQSPSHQCPGTGCPQNMAPCSLQTPVRADRSASDSAVASHPSAQLGKQRPGSQGPESSIPETLQDTPLPPECPCPPTGLAALGFDGALAKVEWMLTGASGAAHAPPMANSTPLLRWTSRTSGFGHCPLNKGKHPLRNTTGLACSLCPLPEWCWLLRGTSARTQLRRGAPDH